MLFLIYHAEKTTVLISISSPDLFKINPLLIYAWLREFDYFCLPLCSFSLLSFVFSMNRLVFLVIVFSHIFFFHCQYYLWLVCMTDGPNLFLCIINIFLYFIFCFIEFSIFLFLFNSSVLNFHSAFTFEYLKGV